MSFFVSRLILIGVITSLVACASFKSYEEKVVQLPYHHSSFDFDVAWNSSQAGNDTVIDGLIKNVRSVQVRDIILRIQVLGPDETFLSDGEVFLENVNLTMNDSRKFSVRVKDATISKGNVLEFKIDYRINNGSWYGRAGQSSFNVDETTGVAIEEQTEKKK